MWKDVSNKVFAKPEVIEMMENIKLIRELKEENAKLRAALEFYASIDNWHMSSHNESLEVCNSDRRTVQIGSPDDEITVGGRRAYRALKGQE